MTGFVHLHQHTEYSLLDGACRINALVDRALAFGHPAVAITDHGNMFGAIELYLAARKAGIKPILGCEVYLSWGKMTEKERGPDGSFTKHQLLVARNLTGWRNLIKLVSAAHLDGFYYKPRVDRETLAAHAEGLIGFSTCLRGEIPLALARGDEREALRLAGEWQEIFGAGNFYLELQDHGIEQQRVVNRGLVELHRRTNIPLVATNDVHYLEQADAASHDVLLCIQGNKRIDDPKRLRYFGDQFYYKSRAEMEELFGELPAALDASLDIAERCDLTIPLGDLILPVYEVPEGQTLESHLTNLAERGLEERLRRRGCAEGTTREEYQTRLRHELDVINHKGYAGYFLIVWDFIHYARRQGIPVGPGRGSAAGSLVAYALGITDLDPIRYRLFFERFLNPERTAMPDIDVDICKDRRDEVIQYVRDKYGERNVAQIITFGRMKARAIVRDVGRAYGMSFAETDRIAKLIPQGPKVRLGDVLETDAQMQRLVAENDRIREALEVARRLEGQARHTGVHAAGVVITPRPLDEFVPLTRGAAKEVTTQVSMEYVEALGLLKMDFLGLRTLTVIKNTLDRLRESKEIELDLDTLPLDDPATFDLLGRGETVGVFQFESAGMQDMLKKFRPTRFEDLIALVSLYRPGPMAMLDDFIDRKHGRKPIEVLHPALQDILAETYGVMVYQEQVMQIAQVLGGYTLGEADLLRRAMGKKKAEQMAKERTRFVQGALRAGANSEVAGRIFDLMEQFAGYGFNKSHAAAYSLLSYQTAYLKAHYPAEFMAAMLDSELDSSDKVVRNIAECNRMGIEVLPPDINESLAHFNVVGERIRFGLAAIKQVGPAAVEAIIEARHRVGGFRRVEQFFEEVSSSAVNRGVIEKLIQAGAFDSLGIHRARLAASLPKLLEAAQRFQRNRQRRQRSLFAAAQGGSKFGELQIDYEDVAEWTTDELMAAEKEALGFYVSSHPLKRYAALCRRVATHDAATLSSAPADASVTVVGVVTSLRLHVTKDKQKMAWATLEDLEGIIELIVFAKTYQKTAEVLVPDVPLVVRGTREAGETNKVRVDEIQRLDELTETARHVVLRIDAERRDATLLEAVRDVVRRHPGPAALHLDLVWAGAEGGESAVALRLRASEAYRVRPGPHLTAALEPLLGEGALDYVFNGHG